MFDDENDSRWPTLVAGLILLIVLAAVAAMPAGSEAMDETAIARSAATNRNRPAASERLVPTPHEHAIVRMLDALEPIDIPMSACFAEDALIRYDLGVAPPAAVDALAGLLGSAAPEVHARLQKVVHEFRLATGLDPAVDFLPFLGHGVAVGLLLPEDDIDGWPLPRKVVIVRVLDEEAVARFLEAWISWVAGAVAPMTHGVLGAWIDTENMAGFDLMSLRLDGLLPARFPLPSPTYAVADGYLVVSPVRSAVAETLDRLGEGCASPPDAIADESVVEEMWLNFPMWTGAWRRAEPLVGSILEWLGVESSVTVQTSRSLVQILGSFPPAHGTTSLTPEGGIVFRIEIEPPR